MILKIMKNQFWVGELAPSEAQNSICCDCRPLVKGKAFLSFGEIIN